MKKAAIILTLILAMLGSVIAGTLASYTTTLSDVASGSVVGKEFIFLAEGADHFQHNIKIAPTETVVWQFSVKNYNGGIVTETDLYYKLTFDVTATSGKSAIEPLIVTVKDGSGNVRNSITGTGTFSITGSFPLSARGQSDDFTVEIFWPSNTDIDINYAGNNFGTTVNVSAIASQVPIGSSDPGGDDEPEQGGVEVIYKTGTAWGEGGHWDPATQTVIYDHYRHQYTVTIVNNTDRKITNWELEFMLNETIQSCWDAANKSDGLPEGNYRFIHPQSYNKHIDPGGSVTFGGIAFGKGDSPMSAAVVDGDNFDQANAKVTNSYFTLG